MTTTEDLFRRLERVDTFQRLILARGIFGDNVKKTAFVTPDGSYEFLRMPFGMKNSRATLV